jgi:hypothetical protein
MTIVNLHGVAFKGQGYASGWMREDSLWSVALGVKLHDGSFNICVSGDHFLFEQNVGPGCVRQAGQARALPCVVRNADKQCDGFIVRTEKTCPDSPETARPNTMFELLSQAPLRTELGLQVDGSPVEILFDPSQEQWYPVGTTS